jgi:hypothetical protein
VHDGINRCLEGAFDLRHIGAVTLDQPETILRLRGSQIGSLERLRIKGIEVIKANHLMSLRQQALNQMTADESGCAGDKYAFFRGVHGRPIIPCLTESGKPLSSLPHSSISGSFQRLCTL